MPPRGAVDFRTSWPFCLQLVQRSWLQPVYYSWPHSVWYNDERQCIWPGQQRPSRKATGSWPQYAERSGLPQSVPHSWLQVPLQSAGAQLLVFHSCRRFRAPLTVSAPPVLPIRRHCCPSFRSKHATAVTSTQLLLHIPLPRAPSAPASAHGCTCLRGFLYNGDAANSTAWAHLPAGCVAAEMRQKPQHGSIGRRGVRAQLGPCQSVLQRRDLIRNKQL